jgi:hypothetical protein
VKTKSKQIKFKESKFKMKTCFYLTLAACILFSAVTVSRIQAQAISPNQVDNISTQITKIAKSVETLNSRMKFFSESFASNQGLTLSEKQQKILFAFELLNRAEQSFSVLQKLKVDLLEKKVATTSKLARNEDDLRTESVDRTVRGTTNAEEVRDIRRKSLAKERADLTVLLNDIQTRLSDVTFDIQQTDEFIKSIRNRVYSESTRELKDF